MNLFSLPIGFLFQLFERLRLSLRFLSPMLVFFRATLLFCQCWHAIIYHGVTAMTHFRAFEHGKLQQAPCGELPPILLRGPSHITCKLREHATTASIFLVQFFQVSIFVLLNQPGFSKFYAESFLQSCLGPLYTLYVL